jgi:hypothetical protein
MNKMQNSITLQYPVFLFDRKDKMVYVYHDDRQMKVSNIEIFAKENFSNITLIDSSGMKYTTKRAFITRYWNFFERLFLPGQVISFDYEYKDVGSPITLDELKTMIMERYPKSRWFHSAWSDVREFKEEMDKCDTFEQVALLFGRPPSRNKLLRYIGFE